MMKMMMMMMMMTMMMMMMMMTTMKVPSRSTCGLLAESLTAGMIVDCRS
jgi:hypothetical protein